MRDPAGCTAVAALVTSDNRIFVVSPTPFDSCIPISYHRRQTQETRDLSSALVELSKLSASTTSRKMPVRVTLSFSRLKRAKRFSAEKARIVAAGGFIEFGRVNGT